MVNFRYVLRYVLLGLPSATKCSKGQPSAELTCQVLPKAPKIPNTKGHVGAAATISSIAENNIYILVNEVITRIFKFMTLHIKH